MTGMEEEAAQRDPYSDTAQIMIRSQTQGRADKPEP